MRSADAVESTPSGRLPGEEGIWGFVGGDLLVFSLFFGTYQYYARDNVELYAESKQALDLFVGTVNTVVLLTSSWLVAHSVRALRSRQAIKSQWYLTGGIVLGFVFCCIKAFEYYEKLIDGYGVGTNEFFMFYFMFTGIHFVHVLVGLASLTFVRSLIRSAADVEGTCRALENGATYWHMVDILWILLFSLLYISR